MKWAIAHLPPSDCVTDGRYIDSRRHVKFVSDSVSRIFLFTTEHVKYEVCITPYPTGNGAYLWSTKLLLCNMKNTPRFLLMQLRLRKKGFSRLGQTSTLTFSWTAHITEASYNVTAFVEIFFLLYSFSTHPLSRIVHIFFQEFLSCRLFS